MLQDLVYVYIPLPYKDFQCSRSQRLHQIINALVKKTQGIKLLISFHFFSKECKCIILKKRNPSRTFFEKNRPKHNYNNYFFFTTMALKRLFRAVLLFCNLISLTFLLYVKSIEDGQRQYIYSNYKYECYIFRMANIFLLHNLFLIICVELRKGKS